MPRATIVLLALFAFACGSGQPLAPLEGTYVVVFDSSFMTPAVPPPSDIEDAIKQLFSERDGSFRWEHQEPKDVEPFDGVIVLRIASLHGPGGLVGVTENRDVTGAAPESDSGIQLNYEVRRPGGGRRSSGSLTIHNSRTNFGNYEPRMLLSTASDLYAILARELQK